MDDILTVYAAARDYMKRTGNAGQWGDHHPPQSLLEDDIKKEHLYVLDNKGIHGVFAFIIGDDPTYHRIDHGAWISDEPYGTIHRIASDGQTKGIFKQCLAFCQNMSDNIRIDTHHDNKTMRHLIEKNGFQRCGIVYMENGSPRIAYQYVKST
ncbi:MAG: N-acetyltransferase [Oscillospiraceae bacterium]|jgi:RimJ/RimL family protein N-acetyltransferase|nr:N-acetyltransferase [Oscillospiraceae bacterium]